MRELEEEEEEEEEKPLEDKSGHQTEAYSGLTCCDPLLLLLDAAVLSFGGSLSALVLHTLTSDLQLNLQQRCH